MLQPSLPLPPQIALRGWLLKRQLPHIHRPPPEMTCAMACDAETGVLKTTRSWWQWEPQWGAAVLARADGLTCTVAHSSRESSLEISPRGAAV